MTHVDPSSSTSTKLSFPANGNELDEMDETAVAGPGATTPGIDLALTRMALEDRAGIETSEAETNEPCFQFKDDWKKGLRLIES